MSARRARAPAERSPGTRGGKPLKTLVLRLVDQPVLGDPRHHAAQLLADFLDLVGVVDAADALEARRPGAVLLHPFRGELSGLDILQYALHLGLGFSRDD